MALKFNPITGELDLVGGAGGGGTDDHSALDNLAYADSGHTGFEPAKGLDDNFVTDAEKTAIGTIGNKLDANTPITGATKTKITYDAKGLVTGGADATTADIADSTNKRYVTDAQLTVLGNTSGTNSGDQTGGTPAITLGTANIAGTSPNFLRRDDTILAFDATALTAEAIGSTSSVGTAATAARRDHRHPMPSALALLAGIGGGYAACATAIGTAAKTLTLSGYRLVVGGVVGVTFTNGNSASNPTININSTGAKPIFYNNAAVTTIAAGLECLLMYDGTNYNIINPLQNSDTRSGIVELATDAETTTGTDTTRALTPANLKNSHTDITTGVHGVGAGSIVGTTLTQTLTNKTLTSPVLNTGVSGTAVLDEDDMATNSATQLATQQSIKAYADTKISRSLIDTWGDLVTADGSNNPITLAVGGNGQLLMADNSQSAGMVWTDTLSGKTITTPTLTLADSSPTAEGSIGYDRTGKDIQLGDGTNSMAIHMGAWTSYTPTLTNITIGNGTVAGAYCQIGKTVHTRIKLTFGNTTSITGAYVVIGVPVTAATYSSATAGIIGQVKLFDSGTAVYLGAYGSQGNVWVFGAGGSYTNIADITSSVPHSWAVNDEILISATYEAA